MIAPPKEWAHVMTLLLADLLALTVFAAPNLTTTNSDWKAFAQSGMKPSPDFNGDGNADLAIGALIEGIGAIDPTGAVNVLYGSSSSGLSSSGNQLWHQDVSGIEGSVGSSDNFGYSLAAGDFDGNGQSDLAIGVIGETVGSIPGSGAVNVIYGSSASGLSASGNQIWSQNSAGVLDTAEPGGEEESSDGFGVALAAGDFDNDGFADLAIGVPGEGIGDKEEIGAVSIIFGSSSGLTASGDQFWTQDSSGVLDIAETFDGFGRVLAVGDFDNDGFADLAIGVGGETLPPAEEQAQGAVNVLYGSSLGLTASGDQFWHQDVPGIESGAETEDHFGTSLAAGDFDKDGFADLAVGVPQEEFGVMTQAQFGAVNVIYGSSSGLTATGDQFWTQDSSGVLDAAEPDDGFGSRLGTGDFNGDGSIDLAVGVLNEAVGSLEFAGAVNVIYGSSSKGLTATNNQFWTQDSPGVEEEAEEFDWFGSSLSHEVAAE